MRISDWSSDVCSSDLLLTVFVASAGLAGLAGAVYATGTGFVAPDMIGLMLSTEVIMWVAVGGRGTLIGPFIGAFVVWWLQLRLSSKIGRALCRERGCT